MKQKRGGALVRGAMFAAVIGLFGSVGCGLLKSGEGESTGEKKAFGAACTKADDCASADCTTYGNVCSKSCTYDKDCGDGMVCRAKDDGSALQCAKPIGSKVGASCKLATECDHGYCLKKADAPNDPGFCSATCQGPGECPDGYKLCQTISDESKIKVCVLGDDTIPIDQRPQFTAPRVTTTTPKTTTTTSATPTTSTTPSATTTPSSAPDAGAPKPDAGTGPVDAGAPASDAGARPKIKLNLPGSK